MTIRPLTRLIPLVIPLVIVAAQSALAQSPVTPAATPSGDGHESRIRSDLRREWLELHPCTEQEVKPCNPFSLGHIVGDAQTLVTGQPLHIALGSLAPQNGFAFGLAFVEHKNYANHWRTTFDTDAVATPNGSWRAGAYAKAFRLESHKIVVVEGPGNKRGPFFHVSPLFNLYAEATWLNHIDFYGLGPNTIPAAKTSYGMTETMAGASAILPFNHFGLSLNAELNGRLPQLRGDHSESNPSIEQRNNNQTAPGLATQPAFLEPAIGLRLQPEIFGGYLRLHYLLQFQNYTALGDSTYSFRRWTADFGHEFPLDRKVHLTAPNIQNGPDSCTSDPQQKCPSPTHVSTAIDHEGSINIRLFMTGSVANAHRVVPFYFDPTIGGSNIDGDAYLASYPDYRFRAPNALVLREAIEHAIPRMPLGAFFSADQAKVAMHRSDIEFNRLRSSYSAGLTIHAGGLPVVYLLFAWGGKEGTHNTFNVSNVLLGASARPSLF
jgi:hypothetical protein